MDATPYYAPSYFAPAYFPSANGPDTPPTGLTPYNAPTYFAPSYFYGFGSPATPEEPDGEGRDEGAYAAIVALIRATGAFAEAALGTEVQQAQAGAGGYPMAIVTPKCWEESDDYDPTSLVRRSTFGIKILVRSEDGSPQFDQLDRLSTAVIRVVFGSDLGGHCLPPLTRIRSGRYETRGHFPEQSIELEGEFSSIFEAAGNAPITF